MAMKYRYVFVGGTFDGLHKGHTALLSKAFVYGKKVTVGLTSHVFVQKYKVQSTKYKVKQFTERKQAIEQWLYKEQYTSRVTIIPINDPYEPAISGDFDALIVTKDNRKTGEEINRRRRMKGINELALIEVQLVSAQDHAPISSTRVRNGEIDHKGRLIMPQSLIPALRKPLGKIVQGKDVEDLMKDVQGKTIITVGDMTTKTLLDQEIIPHLAIVDGMVGRKPFHDVLDVLQPRRVSPFEATCVKSGPGYLAEQAIRVIREILITREIPERQARQAKQVIVVDGEEDLLALPAILYAPIGSVVLYGQPASPYASQGGLGKGIVLVDIDQEVKKLVQKLMKKFLVSK